MFCNSEHSQVQTRETAHATCNGSPQRKAIPTVSLHGTNKHQINQLPTVQIGPCRQRSFKNFHFQSSGDFGIAAENIVNVGRTQTLSKGETPTKEPWWSDARTTTHSSVSKWAPATPATPANLPDTKEAGAEDHALYKSPGHKVLEQSQQPASRAWRPRGKCPPSPSRRQAHVTCPSTENITVFKPVPARFQNSLVQDVVGRQNATDSFQQGSANSPVKGQVIISQLLGPAVPVLTARPSPWLQEMKLYLQRRLGRRPDLAKGLGPLTLFRK